MRAHEEHFRQATRALAQREPFDMEISDLQAMLAINGVAPVSDSVAAYCAEKSGRKGVGLWGFVAAFRAEGNRLPEVGELVRVTHSTSSAPTTTTGSA